MYKGASTNIINGYVVGTNVFSVSNKPAMTELHCQYTLRRQLPVD